jgi:hybrid cluster-associated redox disulfide protein
MSEEEDIKITKKSSIGEVFTKYPETEPVFEKYFGSGCFTCPGSKMEDIAFGAMMHNISPDKIIEELNEAIKKKREGK